MLLVLVTATVTVVLGFAGACDGAAGGVGAGADGGAVGADVGIAGARGVGARGGHDHLWGYQLVDEARKQERLLWYTSVSPDTPLHSSLPLNTAVALPVSLSVFRRDLCFVFFAEHDVNVSKFFC